MGAAEAVIRAGVLKLGGAMLGELLAADSGYRGPRVPCGQGHKAVFVSYRDKSFDTALGLVTVARAFRDRRNRPASSPPSSPPPRSRTW